jgi:DNA (cytosine-5)-methyltransferase 1
LGKRSSTDERNLLALTILPWAAVLRPKVVVVENVAVFADSGVAGKLRLGLERYGYRVEAHVIDAQVFGVPQRRLRSFMIGSKCSASEARLKTKCSRPVSVREAWAGLPQVPNNKNHHYAPTPSALALARMRVIPPGGDKRDVMSRAPRLSPPSWFKTPGEITDVWGRLEWDEPSNTLRTCLLNPSKGRYIHPEQNRVMSLREAARLHSIPDFWEFFGKPTQIARQIGNSVPPLMGRAVARKVVGLLG